MMFEWLPENLLWFSGSLFNAARFAFLASLLKNKTFNKARRT
jgi:hypothetical protein